MEKVHPFSPMKSQVRENSLVTQAGHVTDSIWNEV